MRPRLTCTTWPRPAVVLTDTPRPRCPDCRGEGGHAYDYGDHNGEYAGTDWEPCPCWDDTRRWTLLPLPRLRRLSARWRDPRGTGGYSDEPPF